MEGKKEARTVMHLVKVLVVASTVKGPMDVEESGLLAHQTEDVGADATFDARERKVGPERSEVASEQQKRERYKEL